MYSLCLHETQEEDDKHMNAKKAQESETTHLCRIGTLNLDFS